jgi:ribosomal protein L11 methyltransferase
VTRYPALTVAGIDPDLALAAADDLSPTAAEQRAGAITIFFSDRMRRDAAREAIARAYPSAVATPREVDDEDWARRSQQNLEPVTIGTITIFPSPNPLAPSPNSIVIVPSMGFGTGHHQTTRLCLAALQTIDLTGYSLLDVGTGSGVLAIAARRLGAARAIGIDNDPDAVQAARENLASNPEVDHVSFEIADLVRLKADTTTSLDATDVVSGFSRTTAVVSGFSRTPFDLVTANLTGALLVRAADALLALVRPGGIVIVSGLLDSERAGVAAAFRAAELVWEAREDEWVGMMFRTGVAPELKLGPTADGTQARPSGRAKSACSDTPTSLPSFSRRPA